MRVSELIDFDVHGWNRPLILQLFSSADASAILNIPLSYRLPPDDLVWLHSKNGCYSVRSGYHVACQMVREDNWAKSSSSVVGQSVWKKFWKLKIPNKVKVFGWRACHNALPTSQNLMKRGVLEVATCELCTLFSEDCVHALWECGVAQDIWAGSLVGVQKIATQQVSFLHLVYL